MDLCAGQLRYLLCIYRLQKKGHEIHCVDVAEYMGVSRPSVTKMMKCMVSKHLIRDNYGTSIRLTTEGMRIAMKYDENYELVHAFFYRMMRLSPEQSRDQTLLFLSTFPIDTSDRLATVMKKTLDHHRKMMD